MVVERGGGDTTCHEVQLVIGHEVSPTEAEAVTKAGSVVRVRWWLQSVDGNQVSQP